MKILQDKVSKWLKGHEKDGVQLLQKLVRENSTRGNENKAQAIIIEKCRELGLKPDIWEVDPTQLKDHPFFHSDRTSFSGFPNVAAVWKGSGGGRSLILNSHIDVVPEGDVDDWDDDPFSGNLHDGKIYGRGTTDMKGGTVALLLAMEALLKLNVSLKGDVIFQSVIEEESGGAGTLSAVMRGYRADGAIIPEPTNLKFFPKQQGSMWFRITVKGKAAHGGTKYEGINAIEKSMELLKAIYALEKKRNDKISDPLYQGIPIPIPINIGKIQAGTWPSSVPDSAMIEGRMGVAPGESTIDAETEMKEAILEHAASDPWLTMHPPTIEWFGGRWQPAAVDVAHPLVQTASEAYRLVIGSRPTIEASPWGTDGGILSEWGDTPVLIFGPGITSVAHQSNEFVHLEAVFQAAEVIAMMIVAWCGREHGGLDDG